MGKNKKENFSEILRYAALFFLAVFIVCGFSIHWQIFDASDTIQAISGYSLVLSLIVSFVSFILKWKKNTIAKLIFLADLLIIGYFMLFAVALSHAMGPWMG